MADSIFDVPGNRGSRVYRMAEDWLIDPPPVVDAPAAVEERPAVAPVQRRPRQWQKALLAYGLVLAGCGIPLAMMGLWLGVALLAALCTLELAIYMLIAWRCKRL